MTLTTTDFAALEARVLAAAAPIRAALELVIKPIEARWEASIIERYQDAARGSYDGWLAYLKAEEPTNRHARRSQPLYVRYEKRDHELTAPYGHLACRHAASAGRYSADIKRATQDAEREYRGIREAFLTRLGDKIGYILQGKSAEIRGFLALGRMIEGWVKVAVIGVNACFEMRVKVMTNYRYEENSANGRLTVYSQYPVTFASATVNGETPKPLSEEMLGHLISGLALDHKERATRAEIDARKALNAEKHRVDRVRAAYSDVANDYRWIEDYEKRIAERKRDKWAPDVTGLDKRIAELRETIDKRCATAGIADPGSKKAALAERKKLIEQLKALRAKKEG